MPKNSTTKPLNAHRRRRRTWRRTLARLPLHALQLAVFGVYAVLAIPLFILCVGTSAVAHAASHTATRLAEKATDPSL